MQWKDESREWQAAARARERGLVVELEAKTLKAIRWETRAVESQEREWRMGSNLA